MSDSLSVKNLTQMSVRLPPTDPLHILRMADTVLIKLYDPSKEYDAGVLVLDIGTRWFYYTLQDVPVGTLLNDPDYFIPIPEDIAREKVLTHLEDLSSQIDGTAVTFTTATDILDKSYDLYINGVRQELGNDYEILSSSSIQVLYDEPLKTGDHILLTYNTVAEKNTEYPDEIKLTAEDLSSQIDGLNNIVFDYTLSVTDCINLFYNGIRLRLLFDYNINRGTKQITLSDGVLDDFSTDNSLILETYSQPPQSERRLVTQDIDLSPQISEGNKDFPLGENKIGDTYVLWYNGVKMIKDRDFYFDFGTNTLQLLDWTPDLDDGLILEVYKMI